MSRLNMVRKIKDSKKDAYKIQDTFESKREKGWDERFIYNKLEDNNEKRPLPKKSKNDYTANINYIKEQFNAEKKNNKKRGKSGYKIYHDKNNNKNKIKINSNNIFNYGNNKNINNINNINDINNTGDNEVDTISLVDEKILRYTNNNYKIINRNNNSADYNNNNKNNNNYIGNINNISNNNNSSTFYNMTLYELEVYVNILWNKLCVKDSFQKTFNKVKEDMENDEAKKEFIILEINNLEKLEKFLQSFSLKIEKRENAMLLLKKLIELFEKQFIELNLDIGERILNDFYETIKGYRINTIIVVEAFCSYNELFSYPINKGKFYEEYLIRKYKLIDNDNGNYLLKIRNDVNFLGNSKINGYKQYNFNFSSSNDPFLLSIADQVPINTEYYIRLKQCQYIIMQEVIFDNISSAVNNSNISDINNINDINKKKKLEPINQNNPKSNSNNNNNNTLSPNINIYKGIKKEKENISCVDKKDNIKINNNERKIKERQKNEKIVIETQLIDKNNYNNFFGSQNIIDEQSEEQTLEELKKELNIKKYLKKEDNKIRESKEKENKDNNEELKIKDNKQIINSKENNDNKDNIEIKDNIDDKNNKEINENDTKVNNNNNINENKKEYKEDIKGEEKQINEEIKNDSEINEDLKSGEMTILSEIDNKDKINTNIEEKETNKIIEDKDNNEDYVNLEENININEEQNKNANNINNKDNNIEENILENSLVVSKKDNIPHEKSRSVTPKSQRGSKIISIKEKEQNNKDNNISNIKNEINIHTVKDNDYIAFYCGKLSNFIPIYSSYYNSIPNEQKIIFNIKSDPLEYIHNNFYPKILIYSDKKTKKIKGLCIISHIFTNEAKNNGLFIEHISSYNEDEQETIFEKLLNFIKENSYNIFGFENNRRDKEIYIDLYYKSENGKFTINTNIRDFFRNQLKFKWVKLENLSKFIRFQKMRHQFMINNGNNNIDLLNNEYDDNNILNQSILGRKEFNNDENNNESDEEEESEDDEINVDISTIFEIDHKNNESFKNSNNKEIYDDIHTTKNYNLLNNFSIKNKTILKFNNKNYNNLNKKNITTYIKYSNSFNYIYLLNKINESGNISYDNISPNINAYFNQKDSKIINQIISNCINGNKNIIDENIFYSSDTHELVKEKKNKFKINSNINILPIFDKCISFKYNNYYYNRIQQKKIETFMDGETQQIFYMVNKTDNHILLISSSLNDNFKQKYINQQNKDNISINFMNIYNNLIDMNYKDKNIILYIPAFEIKCKLVNNCFSNINDNDTKSKLYCFEDYYNIKYLTEELTIIKNNKNMKKNKNHNNTNICMNYDYDLITEDDANKQNFIKDDFLLVILNLNVVDVLRALPLLTLYVNKDNFISV